MEFRNLTPFPALAYSALDPDNNEHHVLVMRVTYQLVRQGTSNSYDCMVIDEDPPPLCFADEYFGEMSGSGVRQESDLAPYKPRCDVIVNGTAHMPGGKPARRGSVHVRVQAVDQPTPIPERPHALNPLMSLTAEQEMAWRTAVKRASETMTEGKVLLDKTLAVTGPRWFKKKFALLRLAQLTIKWGTLGLIQSNPWKLTSPQKIAALPIRYEYAFGGQNRINAADKSARRVQKKHRLTPAQLAEHPDKNSPAEQQAVAHEACVTNPIGSGFAQLWWLDASEVDQLPAPQIEWPDAPVNADLFWRVAKGHATNDSHKALTPAGLGCIGRPWMPRLQWAGTYDQQWLDHKHPGLPDDFNFTYWNCAPTDQQTDFLPYDAHITLNGLHPEGAIQTQLPSHRAFVLARYESGLMLPLPLLTDTLIIDTDALTLTLVHRISLRKNKSRQVLEARFETDPAAPLIKRAKEPDTSATAAAPHSSPSRKVTHE